MKKPDRPSRYGGTNFDRSAGAGWLNWHVGRGRLDFRASDKAWDRYKRRVSWRRAL